MLSIDRSDTWPIFLLTVALVAFGCAGGSVSGGNDGSDSGTDTDTDTDTDIDTDADTDSDTDTGCTSDPDCAPTPDTPYCQTSTGLCVECEEGDSVHVCGGGLECCDVECFDTQNDLDNCGSCDYQCNLSDATAECNAGVCEIVDCDPGYYNCDLLDDTGCEETSTCSCVPGSTISCYTGNPADLLVGGTCPAAEGTQECNATGTGYWGCIGDVLPTDEGMIGGNCSDGIDNDCDGTADNGVNLDGDLWGTCDGDCCDTIGPCGGIPSLINPGAFEFAANGVDDDCDGTTDNPLSLCDSGLSSSSSTALHYAYAMDLCQTTLEFPASLADRTWGVVSSELLYPSGSGTPNSNARSIRTGFGNNVSPQGGNSLVVLSTGHAADTGDSSPPYAAFQGGVVHGTSSAAPSDWLAANGGAFPNYTGCPDPMNGSYSAYDPIMLRLRVRVPTNAQSFSFNMYFYSSEYPEYVCSQWNDFFVALLDSTWSGSPANPSDKNLAFYDPPPSGGTTYPIGVNLAYANTGLFKQCLNGPTGCNSGTVAGTCSTCVSTTELSGTGFDTVNPPAAFPGDVGWCGSSNLLGGGTSWLSTAGNVDPGEIITMRFAIWDVGDGYYDSVVLLDNFEWDVDASTPGTVED